MPNRDLSVARRGVAILAFLLLVTASIVGCAKREPSTSAGAPQPGAPQVRKILYWFDPMQPGTRFDHPGKSPYMDMDLVPKYADEVTDTVAGVTLSAGALRAAGVATAVVEMRELSRTVLLTGALEVAETSEVRIASRVAGRVDRLYLGFVGARVTRGGPLYEIWSPELQATERELRVAMVNLEQARAGGDRGYVAAAEGLVESGRQRLRRFGADEGDIEALLAGREARATVLVRSPIGGTVLAKEVVEGQYVMEGQDLYRLADLSTVWLVARVHEDDLAVVRNGQEVSARLRAFPGEEVRGIVTFLDPVLDPATRTARLRIELANRDGRLKPGMFAEATLIQALGRKLAVPRSAVLDTGARRIVYVERDGAFEPRPVEVGAAAGDFLEVRSGLEAGERVVAAGGFMVDAQAQLQTGTAIRWSGASEVKPPGDPK